MNIMERLIYISLIEDLVSTYLWVWSLAAYATVFSASREKKKIPWHGLKACTGYLRLILLSCIYIIWNN